MPREKNGPLNDQGKANKAAILRPLIEAELRAGTEDWKRVMREARAKLLTFPAAQRAGVEITPDDLYKYKMAARTEMRLAPRQAEQQSQTPETTAAANGLPMVNGRVNKRELLRQVIRQEQANGQDIDNARIALIARKRVEQAGLPAVEFGTSDVNNARVSMQKEPVVNRRPSVGPRPATVPPADSVRASELRAAAALLNVCGGSLAHASTVLDLMFSLTQEGR